MPVHRVAKPSTTLFEFRLVHFDTLSPRLRRSRRKTGEIMNCSSRRLLRLRKSRRSKAVSLKEPSSISSLRTELPRPDFELSTKIPRPKVGRRNPPSELLDVPRVGTEGYRRLVSHLRIERDRGLVERKKREVLGAKGSLACEVCRFDFSVYKNLGEEFCEVHHLRPLSKSNAEVLTNLSELAVVCANCHRMIHRGGQSRSLSKVRASRGIEQNRLGTAGL